MTESDSRLDLLKALGDNTRYAIYLELARSPRPLATADVADSLDLHVNTVRPHLERMREVGLLSVRPDTRGAVGRPQKLYSLAADAPSLGLEPPVFPLLSRMLLEVAIGAGADQETVLDAGRHAGRSLAHRPRGAGSCAELMVAMLEELGFDPATVRDDERLSVGFGHCPFAELAEAQPQVVCSLHRGMLEGFVDEVGGAVLVDFHDLSSRTPCMTVLAG
jgi:predicted ArsR family transcriptional regulator